MDTLSVYYVVAVWFFIIAVFNREHRILAATLSTISIVNIIIIDLLKLSDYVSFLEMKAFLVLFDALSAFIIVSMLHIDKTAWKHAAILIFAVVCHIMVLLLFINGSYKEDGFYIVWLILKPFYLFYYENLIILSALLQMVVSYNGLRGAFTNLDRVIQSVFFWSRHYVSGSSKNLHIQEKAKDKK